MSLIWKAQSISERAIGGCEFGMAVRIKLRTFLIQNRPDVSRGGFVKLIKRG